MTLNEIKQLNATIGKIQNRWAAGEINVYDAIYATLDAYEFAANPEKYPATFSDARRNAMVAIEQVLVDVYAKVQVDIEDALSTQVEAMRN